MCSLFSHRNKKCLTRAMACLPAVCVLFLVGCGGTPSVDAPKGADSPAMPTATTIPGDGTFLVGSEARPGTYSSSPARDDRSCMIATRGRNDRVTGIDVSRGRTMLRVRQSDRTVITSGCRDLVRQ